jgi:hypothetical protein
MNERAHRIAERIQGAGGERNMNFIPLDAVAAPGTGGWRVPEPSASALEHMASFGFVQEEPTEAPPAIAAAAVVPTPDMAAQIAAGVVLALQAMGFKPPEAK